MRLRIAIIIVGLLLSSCTDKRSAASWDATPTIDGYELTDLSYEYEGETYQVYIHKSLRGKYVGQTHTYICKINKYSGEAIFIPVPANQTEQQ